jgi:hypothetical protein
LPRAGSPTITTQIFASSFCAILLEPKDHEAFFVTKRVLALKEEKPERRETREKRNQREEKPERRETREKRNQREEKPETCVQKRKGKQSKVNWFRW